jgi:hypothetical protein
LPSFEVLEICLASRFAKFVKPLLVITSTLTFTWLDSDNGYEEFPDMYVFNGLDIFLILMLFFINARLLNL